MSRSSGTARDSHVQFAVLLWYEFKEERIFGVWAPLFPFVYGHSVEEIALSYRHDDIVSAEVRWLLS